MIKGLLTTLIFCILTLGMLPTISAQNGSAEKKTASKNNLENKIVNYGNELIIVVVDTEGFSAQNKTSAKDYEERYQKNLDWFKENWSSFVLSVDKEQSYRVRIDAKKFATLSDSQKSKINQLYNTSFTNRFDPVGIATSQMHGIVYNPKTKGNKESFYQKLSLDSKDINDYIHSKTKTAVLVIDTDTANQIGTILSH